MDNSIQWKEAKGGQQVSDSEQESEENEQTMQYYTRDVAESELVDQDEQDYEDVDDIADQVSHSSIGSNNKQSSFHHRRLNLNLRRNITALGDPKYHKGKQSYATEKNISFERWLDNAIVTISPTADLILFAGQIPEKVTFFAKLRTEPINQYVTKTLNIPLDFNEQVTSLICLPIMSTQRTASGIVDWTALVIGFSSGYVKFYTEQNICLLSLKFCDEPVLSLKCQTQKSNLNGRSETHFPNIIDELLITHKTSIVIAEGLTLYENLRIAKNEVVKSNCTFEPAYNLTNLPTILNCQKWLLSELSSTNERLYDTELLGSRRTTDFDSLVSESINMEHVPAKSTGRALATVGKNLFINFYKESNDSKTHSYTEIIGSIFSLWNKPQPSPTQVIEVTNYNNISLFDRDRLATSIVSSPDKRLAAVTDDFGRVHLVDCTNWLVVRMWKGYRSAQCGWIEVKRSLDKRDCPHASFLVIYAPKRGLLEVWSTQRGPRVVAFNVGKNCRLLYSGYSMFNMRSDRNDHFTHPAEQSYSSNCYLLNAESETIFSIEVPYTYSLYKYGDLKSRDHLLIGELNQAIQNDAEVELISEILHRIALPKSLQTSIQKLASSLIPDKIIPIMENLIFKTMKNYDNHSGETITNDDLSIIELCKRLIRLCTMFTELSQSAPHDLALPDVNQRLIDEYEEHPEEIDKFAELLGCQTSEILRYLSLLSLERSYQKNHHSNPWPSLGEPLAWAEFVSCFDLYRYKTKTPRCLKKSDRGSTSAESRSANDVSIRLKKSSSDFLNQDKVIKTALFMYNRLGETYFNKGIQTTSSSRCDKKLSTNNYNYLEPSSRLGLLFQFWLSTKLCNHWKMWTFLQDQVGQISDELKVIAMDKNDDSVLIDSWKQIYNLILESDNILAALTATAVIRSDTLRMISDNEKREKLEKEAKKDEESIIDSTDIEDDSNTQQIDWECLCIDAERMSLLSQQLEDVFLLSMLLRYSVDSGHLIDNHFVYRVPRISVANVIRGGPTIVSELVAQWAIQAKIDLKIFTEPYGKQAEEGENIVVQQQQSPLSINLKRSRGAAEANNMNNEEHVKELLHHTITSFPLSLEADVILLYCIWEMCRNWANNLGTIDKTKLFRKAHDGITLVKNIELRYKLTSAAYKTFFQRTLERLVILVETNSTIVNIKSSKVRDALTRRELNMAEDCLEDFIQFCCDFSELMLQTCMEHSRLTSSALAGSQLDSQELDRFVAEIEESRNKLLRHDNWWSTPTMVKRMMLDSGSGTRQDTKRRKSSSNDDDHHHHHQSEENINSLVRTILLTSNLLDLDFLIELNRLANLLNLIFQLKIIKAYPISLLGEESLQLLKLDLQQAPIMSTSSGLLASLKNRSLSLQELRQKFARKCILNIVSKMVDDSGDFDEDDRNATLRANPTPITDNKDIDIRGKESIKSNHNDLDDDDDDDDKLSPFIVDKKQRSSNKSSFKRDPQISRGGKNKGKETNIGTINYNYNNDDDDDEASASADDYHQQNEQSNETMILFTNLLSLAKDWNINCDELHLELVFELYRCNLDSIGAQISTRVFDKQTLATGLLKISSQRVLVLFGLSPNISESSNWKKRVDIWSNFQPNVSSWLKAIQQEEIRKEIACLSFSQFAKLHKNEEDYYYHGTTTTGAVSSHDDYDDDDDDENRDVVSDGEMTQGKERDEKDTSNCWYRAFGVQLFVLHSLRRRTSIVLEAITNHLEGQAEKLAYDLLELLESKVFDKFIATESQRRRWLR